MRRALTAVLIASLALVGCSLGSRGGPLSALTAGGGFRVEVTPTPDPIPVNEHFSVTVRVSPASRSLPGTLEMTVDADMPEHRHGMNVKPAISRVSQDTFKAQGLLFHMPGSWELYVDVSADGRTERATLPILLR